jgi:hypothetical protein
MTDVASSFPSGESAGKSSRELALPMGFGVPEGGGTGWEGRAPHPAVARMIATMTDARKYLSLPGVAARFLISFSGQDLSPMPGLSWRPREPVRLDVAVPARATGYAFEKPACHGTGASACGS